MVIISYKSRRPPSPPDSSEMPLCQAYTAGLAERAESVKVKTEIVNQGWLDRIVRKTFKDNSRTSSCTFCVTAFRHAGLVAGQQKRERGRARYGKTRAK